jgi:aryl-alcohol dehydrogenase-like predicted oxidoreductase
VGQLGDFRGHTPRFQGENLTRNLALADALREAAAGLGLTPARAAIAWVAAQGDDIVPLVGARRRERLAEALGGLSKPLSASDLAVLERAVPRGSGAGDRYPAVQMAMLDSERA